MDRMEKTAPGAWESCQNARKNLVATAHSWRRPGFQSKYLIFVNVNATVSWVALLKTQPPTVISVLANFLPVTPPPLLRPPEKSDHKYEIGTWYDTYCRNLTEHTSSLQKHYLPTAYSTIPKMSFCLDYTALFVKLNFATLWSRMPQCCVSTANVLGIVSYGISCR